jgi:hypothetical protein
MRGAIPPPSQYASMARRSVKSTGTTLPLPFFFFFLSRMQSESSILHYGPTMGGGGQREVSPTGYSICVFPPSLES